MVFTLPAANRPFAKVTVQPLAHGLAQTLLYPCPGILVAFERLAQQCLYREVAWHIVCRS